MPGRESVVGECCPDCFRFLGVNFIINTRELNSAKNKQLVKIYTNLSPLVSICTEMGQPKYLSVGNLFVRQRPWGRGSKVMDAFLLTNNLTSNNNTLPAPQGDLYIRTCTCVTSPHSGYTTLLLPTWVIVKWSLVRTTSSYFTQLTVWFGTKWWPKFKKI